ncbi:MAG TPA: hypothetical protein VHE55_17455 [Fimbriimonadaceae bacterium]|nr:hypothetical protein [Fimbriimonadaceae bacterium]
MDAKPNYFMAWLFVACQSLIVGIGDAWRLARANAPIFDLFWLVLVQVGCILLGFGSYNLIVSVFMRLRLGMSAIPWACLALLASFAIAWYGFEWCAPLADARRSGALVVPSGGLCFTVGSLIAYFIRMARQTARPRQSRSLCVKTRRADGRVRCVASDQSIRANARSGIGSAKAAASA